MSDFYLATKPTTTTITKAPDTPTAATSNDKTNDEPTQKSTPDDNPDGEEIADDLSEISDEADEILGQQEVYSSHFQARFLFLQAIDGVINGVFLYISFVQDGSAKTQPNENVIEKTVQDEPKESPVQKAKDSNDRDAVDKSSIEQNESLHAGEQHQLLAAKSPDEPDSKDLCDDIDLDFEEISDGELEEEARTKGLGDALGVDWASLIEESKAMMREKLTKTETSVKQRWMPDQILLDAGISYKMAGADFAQKTLIKASENVKREMKTTVSIKTEPFDGSNHVLDGGIVVKTENDIDGENAPAEVKVNGKCEKESFNKGGHNLILHPLPCVQTSVERMADKQRRLVFNAAGPYSRGLCTKRDIEMRRQLCNLAINESNCKTANTRTGYENIALKLFQKALQA